MTMKESSHHHHHDALDTSSMSVRKALIFGIILNAAYVVIEGVYGFMTDSMGLLSDAGHNLSDVASLFISLLAYQAMRHKPTHNFTYGFGRATVTASVINALLLYVAAAFILIESISKLMHPVAVEGLTVAWVAGVGVVINGLTAWLLMHGSTHDLNIKGAFLHMMADMAVSVGVAVSGAIIHFTGFYILDPVIGIIIAMIIAVTSWSLLKESVRLNWDAVPAGIEPDEVKAAIEAVPYVRQVHHMHIWALTTTEVAMTVHVIIDSALNLDKAIAAIRKTAREEGIDHATIEAETSWDDCGQCDE